MNNNFIITPEKKQELLKIDRKDLSISNITKLFGYSTKVTNDNKFTTQEPKFKTNAKFTLKAGEYINTTDIETNVGIFLFNKLLIEGKLESTIPNGYYNEVLDKKKINKLFDIISNALMMKKIEVTPTLVTFLKDYEFYGLKLSAIFAVSYTMNFIKPNKELMKEKEEKLKNIDLKDVQAMTKFEDKLVEDAKEKLKNDQAMPLFASGARGSFENDYKNMSAIIGSTYNPITKNFDFVSSNYTEGLTKKNIVPAANTIVTASYPKAIGTARSGYQSKSIYSVFSSVTVDLPGTNCGTKIGLDIYLSEKNIDLYLYQNIILEDDTLVNLNQENYKAYLNKNIRIRTPMFCLSNKICSKCAGMRFEILDIKNVGLTSVRVSNTLMNLNMKARHSTKVNLDEVDVNSLII
jgi:hypothetical protein